MNRFIDADKLIAEIENMNNVDYGSFMDYDVHRGADYMKHDVLAVIDEQPTADMVELVQCSDCKYGRLYMQDQGYMEPPTCEGIICSKHKGLYMDFTDYCSYGKRREK